MSSFLCYLWYLDLLSSQSSFINIITSRDVFMFPFSVLCYFLGSVHPRACSHLTMTTGWQTLPCKWEHFYFFLHPTPTPSAPDSYSHMVLGMENFCSYQIGPTNHLKICGNHITAASLVFFLTFKIYLAEPGLSCGMWDVVPQPGTELGSPALGAWILATEPLGSPTESDFSRVFKIVKNTNGNDYST